MGELCNYSWVTTAEEHDEAPISEAPILEDLPDLGLAMPVMGASEKQTSQCFYEEGKRIQGVQGRNISETFSMTRIPESDYFPDMSPPGEPGTMNLDRRLCELESTDSDSKMYLLSATV